MKFSDIPGQAKVKDALRALVDSGKMPHALMLCGPSGIGKMMLSRALIQYAHCLAPHNGEPCGECAACRQHLSHNHPDVHYIYPIVKSVAQKILTSEDRIDLWQKMLDNYPEMTPERWLDIIDAGNSQPTIYVQDADAIIRSEAYSSYNSKYKFYVIWLPEKLQLSAANKLLKVIEEPNESTVFLLVTNNEAEVLPTISSRTRKFHLLPASEDELSEYIGRRYGLDSTAAQDIAHLSGGRMAKAVEIASHSGEREEFGSLFRDIMRAAYGKKPEKLREIGDKTAGLGREKIRRFLSYMSMMVRENFIYNLKVPQLSSLTKEEAEFSSKFSPFIHHSNVEDIVREIERASLHIERNGNSKIILFSLFLLIIPLLHKQPK